MNNEEFLEQFEKNVAFLKRNIAPDDIYDFTEQVLISANYFLLRWREWINVNEEMKRDPVAKKWITNLCTVIYAQEHDIDVKISTGFVKYDENSDKWTTNTSDEDEA